MVTKRDDRPTDDRVNIEQSASGRLKGRVLQFAPIVDMIWKGLVASEKWMSLYTTRYLFVRQDSAFSRPLWICHWMYPANKIAGHLSLDVSWKKFCWTLVSSNNLHLTLWALVKSTPRLSVFFWISIGSIIPVLDKKLLNPLSIISTVGNPISTIGIGAFRDFHPITSTYSFEHFSLFIQKHLSKDHK